MHAGERSVRRLVRDLAEMGYRRTPKAVYARLDVLALVLAELRVELTLATCGQLTGRTVPTLMAHVRRKYLTARMTDGAWRVWPADLRTYVLADKARVDWSKVELRHELLGLMGSEWGVSEDTERRRDRARRREHAGAPCAVCAGRGEVAPPTLLGPSTGGHPEALRVAGLVAGALGAGLHKV